MTRTLDGQRAAVVREFLLGHLATREQIVAMRVKFRGAEHELRLEGAGTRGIKVVGDTESSSLDVAGAGGLMVKLTASPSPALIVGSTGAPGVSSDV